jgi:stage V sporulation protein SpoVS
MRARLTAAALLAASALGACGGDNASKDEQQARAVAKEAMTTKDPGACTRIVTRKFIEQTTLERGADAISSCRDGSAQIRATSVSIDRVAVSGPNASVEVRPEGGVLPFRTATLGLRKAGGRWQVNRLKGGTLDRAALARVMRQQLTAPPDAVSAGTVDCAVDELAGTPAAEIVRAYVKPDPRQLLIPVVVCTVRVELKGTPRRLVACIERGVARELTTGALGRKLRANPSSVSLLRTADGERLGGRVARACVRTVGATAR